MELKSRKKIGFDKCETLENTEKRIIEAYKNLEFPFPRLTVIKKFEHAYWSRAETVIGLGTNGKGINEKAAIVSALAESIERLSTLCSLTLMPDRERFFDPGHLYHTVLNYGHLSSIFSHQDNLEVDHLKFEETLNDPITNLPFDPNLNHKMAKDVEYCKNS